MGEQQHPTMRTRSNAAADGTKRRVTMSPDLPAATSPGAPTRQRERSIHIPDWLPAFLSKPGPLRNLLPYMAILVWYCFNMSVVLSNRWIFTQLPLPTSLTLLHSVTGLVVSTLLLATRPRWGKWLSMEGSDDADKPPSRESAFTKVAAFLPVAISLTGNNYFSNLSMRFTSAPFTQTIKAIVPVVTMLVYYLYAGRQYERSHYLAMSLVVSGVFIASAAEVSLNYLGLGAALIASVFTALKVVLSNDRTKKLDPLVTVNTMAPYSIVLLIPVFYSTELDAVLAMDREALVTWLPLLFAHGLLVLALNLVTFFTMAVNSPTTMTCCGNMKVMFVYILSWFFLGTELGLQQLVGASLTIFGGVCFGLLQEGYRIVWQEGYTGTFPTIIRK